MWPLEVVVEINSKIFFTGDQWQHDTTELIHVLMRVGWLTANVHDVTLGCIEHHAPGTGPLFQSSQINNQHGFYYAMHAVLYKVHLSVTIMNCSKSDNPTAYMSTVFTDVVKHKVTYKLPSLHNQLQVHAQTNINFWPPPTYWQHYNDALASLCHLGHLCAKAHPLHLKFGRPLIKNLHLVAYSWISDNQLHTPQWFIITCSRNMLYK